MRTIFVNLFYIKEDEKRGKEVVWYLFAAYLAVLFLKLLFLKLHPYDGSAFYGSDGGLYAYYARELLKGFSFPFDSEHLPAYLLFCLHKLTGLSVDKLIFYTPVFISSLSVVPVILIGYAYKIVRFSFFVSIVGSITYAYYIRSFIGYYDTDILNVTLSTIIVACMILLVEKKKIKYLFYLGLSVLIFLFWYHSSKIIIILLFLNFIIYLLIIKRKNLFFNKKSIFIVLLFILILGFWHHSDLESFFQRGKDYFSKTKNTELHQKNGNILYFKNTLQTVSEAQNLSILEYGKYYSLSNWYFLLSLFSVILFSFIYNSFFLALPLLFLSLMSFKLGVRFTEYGVLIVAFGSIYFLYIMKNILHYFDFNKYLVNFLFVFSLGILIYHYIYIVIKTNNFLHPKLTMASVQLLKKFDKTLTKDDFIITWWDMGWILWYYTKANTIIDNGKHFEDTYIVSKLLFSKQNYTAKASKFFLNLCKSKYCYISKKLFVNYSPSDVDKMIYSQKETQKSKQIYFIFYKRMIKILDVILKFSDVDLERKGKTDKKFLHIWKIQEMEKGYIYTKKESINLIQKKLNIRTRQIQLHSIYIKNKTKIEQLSGDPSSKLYAIIYENTYVILCNETIFNSFVIQAMILDNYDKKLFKLVDKNEQIKILKLK